MCPRRSVKNYLWTWFPIDFVSSISPVLDYFIWWAARGTIVMPGKGFNGLSGPPSTCDGGANGLAMARLLKIGRIFKIFKVLRIAKLVKMGNDSADSASFLAVSELQVVSRHRGAVFVIIRGQFRDGVGATQAPSPNLLMIFSCPPLRRRP